MTLSLSLACTRAAVPTPLGFCCAQSLMRLLRSAEIRLFWSGFVPRCRRACLDSDMSGGAFLLSFTLVLKARLAPIPRLPIVAVVSFSRSLSPSLMLVCCRFEICNIVPGAYAEVGCRQVLDLAACHRLRHLYLSWHLWSYDSFLRNLDQLLKLFDITLTRSFQGVRIPLGTSLVELEIETRLLFALKSQAPCATERQCLFPKAETQSCW